MSRDTRKTRSRVQGAWARPAQKTASKSTFPHRTTASQFVFQQPVQMNQVVSEPYNFSWVIPGLLAALGMPRGETDFQFLKENGIKTLVSLIENKPSFPFLKEMKWIHLSIIDFHPPTIAQIEQFIAAVDDAEQSSQPLAVHCMHGNGRTGTMIACYFVKTKNMTAKEAISFTRQLRPKSLETRGQEQRVADYEQYLKQKQT